MSYEFSFFRVSKSANGGITISGLPENDPVNEESITITLETVDSLIAALKKLKDEMSGVPE